MRLLTVRHITSYRYKQPVAFGEHRMMLRPRDSYDQRLIEVRLDILNPIQPKSMDPAKVKKLYGDKLTFWGTVDIQEVLPFGTPEDVANEVKLRIQTVGKGGGLIISPAHNIQSQVPLANILAFYESAKKFGRYPLAD